MSLGKHKTKLLGKTKIDYKEIYFFGNLKKCSHFKILLENFKNVHVLKICS